MNSAIILTQAADRTTVTRSDMAAAKILQSAIKEGRGQDVLADPKTKMAEAGGVSAPAKTAPKPAQSQGIKPDASAVEKKYAASSQSSRMELVRHKIDEMTRALESLKQAFEQMGDYRSVVMESDDATAVAFAGNVLREVEAEKAQIRDVEAKTAATSMEGTERADAIHIEAGRVRGVEAGGSDDAIGITAEKARYVSGGSGSDGIAIEARQAVGIKGGSGDDAIAVDAMRVWSVKGGSGDDQMAITGERVSRVSGGTGDDVMSVKALRADSIKSGAGDDRMAITARHVSEISDGAGDDEVTIIADKVTGLMSSEGDDVYNLNVGQAQMVMRAGMGNDTVNLTSGSHLSFAFADSAMMEGGAVSAVWEGDDLTLTFGNGDTLRIGNAANAGSISMQAGGTMLTLMAPKTPISEGLLDIAV